MATDPIEHLRESMRPWLERHARPAWRPIVDEAAESPATASRFGGAPWLAPGEDWPSCTTCGQPLQFFLQLDLGALPPELDGRFGPGLLQLFYCTNDGCSATHWEAFTSGKMVRIVDPTEFGEATTPPAEPPAVLLPAKTITGWKPQPDRPHPPEHEDLGVAYAFDFKQRTVRVECASDGVAIDGLPMSAPEDLSIALPGDKLAGWPMWIQGVEYPTCPRCGRVMQLVFQVDSDDNVPFMFGDVGTGHVMQCPVHTDTVTFTWACS
jgi:uncharacterized protein YwqG